MESVDESERLDPDDDDTSPILVSEFPPPPFYYALSSTLSPPEIPTQSFLQVSQHVQSLIASSKTAATNRELPTGVVTRPTSSSLSRLDHGTVVMGEDSTTTTTTTLKLDTFPAVFGEIVEDPLLMHVDDCCENPRVIRDEILRLKSQVLSGFVQLVQYLVIDPVAHRESREDISQNILNMLLEANKLREHQAREMLIQVMEAQLASKIHSTDEIRKQLEKGIQALDELTRTAAAGNNIDLEPTLSTNT